MLAHWPWARLEASPTTLSLSAPVLGRFVFSPEDVLRIDGFKKIPILYWGVWVHHIRKDMPRIIRFTTVIGPTSVLKGIEEAGFHPRGVEQDICLECGATMSAQSDSCSKCGWSYARSGTNEA
jgi:ribosomal protein L40E